jgi:hypothetical protein
MKKDMDGRDKPGHDGNKLHHQNHIEWKAMKIVAVMAAARAVANVGITRSTGNHGLPVEFWI